MMVRSLGLATAAVFIFVVGCGELAPPKPTVVVATPDPPAPAPTAVSVAVHDEEPAPKVETTASPRASASPAGLPFTCVMHPQIHKAAAGTCPICGMDLVEVLQR